MLPSAAADLVNILDCVTRESGNLDAGLRLVGALRQPCRRLAVLPGRQGYARPELRPDIRSIACDDVGLRSYVILFRYAGDAFEVVNIIDDDPDIEAVQGRPLDRPLSLL
jgi:toxin ParE1/3/4